MFLKKISDMDPNNINSITRNRDYKFLKNLYTKVMKEYNFAMGEWKEGTGGGPGRPENYNDWDQRDGEAFATYRYKVRDKYVEKDNLAWIYMLDLVTGFAFNSASDPAPDVIVREDSNEGDNGTIKGKRGNHFGSAVAQFSKDFQELVTKAGFKEMTKVINVEDEKAGGRNRDDDDDIVDKTMLCIDSISTRIEKEVEVLIEEGNNVRRHFKRLRILEKTLLDTTYSALLEKNDNNDDEDSDDDEDDNDNDESE